MRHRYNEIVIMSDSTPGLDFHETTGDKMWDMEGQIGQSTGAATLDVEKNEETHTFSKFPDSAVDIEEEDATDTSELIKQKKNPVWSFAYYQEFFDVDTSTVLYRIKGSMIPLPGKSFSHTYIGGKPDIFGPFWICATLVLSISVCGNLTTLFSHWADNGYSYKPEFELLPIAAIIIYSYTFLVPLLVKAFFWWRNSSTMLSVSQMICTYGYSLFVFIPASILFIVPYDVFDWIIVAAAICLSGTVILITLWPALRDDNKNFGIIVLIIIFLLHAGMAISLRLYFFSSMDQVPADRAANATTEIVKQVSTKSVIPNPPISRQPGE
ncbi:unnamed protein product [Clavelina lepadiformis]|uniref:Protein YIPF n=1 Tax=Clavelina lepadiformis TaxID=159417 RepID=A0ABP0FRD3_CLALP